MEPILSKQELSKHGMILCNKDLYHLKLQDVSKAVCKQKIYQHLLGKYPVNENNNNNIS